MKIDFYVELIDNFWDLGFAYNIFLNLIKVYPDLEVRFFSNSHDLFMKLSYWKKSKQIKYFDLKDITKYEPNKIIFNFFDRKVNYEYLNKFDFNIKLINFWYFSTHNNSKNLHLTSYSQKNVYVTHFIPSFILWTWWVIINEFKNISKKQSYKWLPEQYYQKTWVSVFVYKETFDKIKRELLKQKDYLFFIFDERNELSWENIIKMPFLEINDYYNFLNVCDKNLVRWENSLIAAIIWNKPFLWDIYKEFNDAHNYKLNEFLDFIWDTGFKELTKEFNSIEETINWFKKFLNFENKDLFNEKGDYIIKNCDLIKNLVNLL